MGSLAMTIVKCGLLSCLIELEAWEFQSFYVAADTPVVTYLDPSVFAFVNFTSSRYGRRREQYYYNLHMESSKVLDNNYTMKIDFYEAVNTEYKRSFIKIHYKLCDFVYKDHFFGASFRKQLKLESCPFPKGPYHIYNMTVSADHLPPMPFTKGRINMDLYSKKKNVFKGYTDLELKRKKKNSL